MLVHGAIKRVRPKAMTVNAAFMGLPPIMWSTGVGTAVLAALLVGCSTPDSHRTLAVEQDLLQAFDRDDVVDVIVGFADPAPYRLGSDLDGHRAAIKAVGRGLATNSGLRATRSFEHVPAVAGRLSRDGLATLLRDPSVTFIQLDSPGQGHLTVSVPAIGADVAKNQFHVTGKGVRVAVLDTGINSSHPDLKSSIVATQHCFTRNACPPSNTAEGTSAEDDHGHGSHVSGIVTSDGVVAGAGFAPDAEIVAVKVNDSKDSGVASDWTAGFDWIFSNLATLKVNVVNASFGTDQGYASAADCDRGQPALAKAVKNLVDAGVTVFASSGNRGSTQIGAPACNTGAIAVGATYKSNQGRQPSNGTYAGRWGSTFADCADETTAFDKVACFTNSGPRLDILAPGAVIVSDSLGTRTESYWGTSQASPTAAGVAALLLECQPSLAPAAIKDILVRTAVQVTDPRDNATYPSIRALAAVQATCAGAVDAGAGPDAGRRDALDTSSDGRSTDTLGAGGSAGSGGRGGVGAGGTGGIASDGGSTGRTGGVSGAGGTTSPGSDGNAAGGAGGGSGGSGTAGAKSGSGGSPTGGSVSSGGLAGGPAGGASGTGGAPNSTGGAAGTTDHSTSSGCSCRAGQAGGPRRFAIAGILGLLAMTLARRRRRASNRPSEGQLLREASRPSRFG